MEWDAEQYDDGVGFVHELGEGVLDWLAPEPGERVVDVGCGTGHLTAAIAEAGADVVGVDRSPSMLSGARAEYPELALVRADATALPFAGVDAVFSNAALHWVGDQDAAVASVAAALREGGRFVAEMGGAGNVAAVRAAFEGAAAERGYDLPDPWVFPTVEEAATRLERHGFEVRRATLFDRPTPLSGEDGFREWASAFGDSLLSPVPADERPSIVADAEARARPDLLRDGEWVADYRRLRFEAVLR
jgi:SAM-dependent methyltransferase